MLLHSDTLSRFQVNPMQSLLFLLNAAQLIPDRGSNPRSTTLEASLLTNTPSMRFNFYETTIIVIIS
jgi:hypothetical protein